MCSKCLDRGYHRVNLTESPNDKYRRIAKESGSIIAGFAALADAAFPYVRCECGIELAEGVSTKFIQ